MASVSWPVSQPYAFIAIQRVLKKPNLKALGNTTTQENSDILNLTFSRSRICLSEDYHDRMHNRVNYSFLAAIQLKPFKFHGTKDIMGHEVKESKL